MLYFLGYEVVTNGSITYVFYLLNFTNHSSVLITVDPTTHTVLNYSTAWPISILALQLTGTPSNYVLGNNNVPAIESVEGNTIIVISYNHVLLEEVSHGQTTRLVYANFPGLANESPPDFWSLAGHVDLLPFNLLTALGILAGLQLYLVLRRVIR
jgi:hypothetical protein